MRGNNKIFSSFFFNDTATTEIYTLSLHDALPISDHDEVGLLHPLGHGLGPEAEAQMGVLLAQEFEVVRREIDHHQPALRPQHARRLADRARAVVEEVEHLMDDDDVKGIARQRKIVDVA